MSQYRHDRLRIHSASGLIGHSTMRRLAAALSIVAIAAGCSSNGVQRQEIALRPVAAGCELRIDIGGDGTKRVSFPAGSAALAADEQAAIDRWIDGQRWRECIPRISVVTRAQWTAPGEVDLDLAQRRAAAMQDILVEGGFPGDLIVTDVLGPLYSFSEIGDRYDAVAEIVLSELIDALDKPDLCRRWR